jgi:hypothetical protein
LISFASATGTPTFFANAGLWALAANKRAWARDVDLTLPSVYVASGL